MDQLDSRVLVLNRCWQVVNVIAARRALSLVYVGHGRVVDRDFATLDWEEWVARPVQAGEHSVAAVSFAVAVPRVLVLTEYALVPRPRIRLTRTNVLLRDRHRCQYCGRRARPREITLDHVVPRSRGGRMTWANIVAACVACNSHKRDRDPEEAGMNLLRDPAPPAWHPAVAVKRPGLPLPEWGPFLTSLPELLGAGE